MLVGDALGHWGRVARSRIAAVYPETGERLTYGELDARAWRVAHALRRAGADHGASVLALTRNARPTLELYHGAARAGVTIVPLSERLAPAELSTIARHCGAVGAVVSAPYLARLGNARDGFRFLWVASGAAGGADRFDDVVALEPAEELPDRPSEAVALFRLYTSGTTGDPKAVITSQRAWAAALWAQALSRDCDPSLVYLHVLPLGHAGGTNWLHLAPFVGGRLVVLPGFDPEPVLAAIERERVTQMVVVPTMLQMLLDVHDRASYDLSSLRILGFGGAFMPPSLLDRARSELGVELRQGYGLSELAGSFASALVPRHVDERDPTSLNRIDASAGQAMLGIAIEIVDDAGLPAPRGTIGEIWLRGDMLMDGYVAHGELSAETITDGWLRTGDLGVLDEAGFLFVIDRKKEVIITGGLNVHPREVERVLLQAPGVAEAYVLGVPDPLWGERVVACVVPVGGGEVEPDVVRAFCAGRIAGYKQPRSLLVLDASRLPRSALGKVVKGRLVGRFQTEEGLRDG